MLCSILTIITNQSELSTRIFNYGPRYLCPLRFCLGLLGSLDGSEHLIFSIAAYFSALGRIFTARRIHLYPRRCHVSIDLIVIGPLDGSEEHVLLFWGSLRINILHYIPIAASSKHYSETSYRVRQQPFRLQYSPSPPISVRLVESTGRQYHPEPLII